MTRDEAHAALIELAREGWLLGVAVFGTDSCCLHGEHSDCEATGYGLCDTQNALSDCNRAEPFLMRPRDTLMTPELRVHLSDEDIGWGQHDNEPAPAPSVPVYPFGDPRAHTPPDPQENTE